ncbi:hypothetical protein BCR32DRAFT_247245 [Anaeromyces robustus]|uniref:G-protein coupled receptors family 3 profile domain-containing protein n=1 Tax=Anaeromyces robustus TaxID=1754192 RepID=A0A1Y1WYC3_9FUNG|nr:hypothetical protein BCR32DRAFT_247245 [Anaeromyces robustus]|eukprot:ORX78328.1 hypothetical protein BCR32DRAFT_247245 [Anaeromyces robustus]
MGLYLSLVNGFNRYSKENNLDIELVLNTISPENSTTEINSYGTSIDALLNKKSTKYDIYFYFGTYTNTYGSNFADLRDYLPKEHIDLYDKNIIDNTCTYDKKLVGLMILSSILTMYGLPTPFKCQLKSTLVIDGLYISLCPILYVLIINFPDNNKFSEWVQKSKYIFMVILIGFITLVSIPLFLTKYNLVDVIINEGKSFKKCLTYATLGKIFFIFVVLILFFMILMIILLIFMEWNMKKIKSDLKLFFGAIIIDCISIVIYNISVMVNIKSYNSLNILIMSIVIIFGFSNFIFTYGVRLYYSFIKKDTDKYNLNKFLGKSGNVVLKTNSYNENKVSTSTTKNSQNNESKNSQTTSNNNNNTSFKKLSLLPKKNSRLS